MLFRSGGLHPDVEQDLWDKWVLLGTIASMCAAMRGTVGDFVAAEDGVAIVRETLDECCAVAAANGHPIDAKVKAGLDTALTTPGSKQVASILGDIEKGGPVESRQIVGDMLARARAAGIAAPIRIWATASSCIVEKASEVAAARVALRGVANASTRYSFSAGFQGKNKIGRAHV